MLRQFLSSKKALATVSLVVIGTFIFSGTSVGYSLTKKGDSADITDSLRPRSTAQDDALTEIIAEDLGYGFASGAGEMWAHDKIFRVRAATAFTQGRAVGIFGHQADEDLVQVAGEFLKRSGELGVTEEEVVERLVRARQFLDEVFSDELIERVVREIAKIDEDQVRQDIEQGRADASALPFLQRVKVIVDQPMTSAAHEGRDVLVRNTRFITFLFGMRGLDPFLFSVGNILSPEYRAIVAHIGGYAYDGSPGSEVGGPRTIYTTLARILDYAERGQEGLEAYREMMLHEFLDRARGRHVAPAPSVAARLQNINNEIDQKYRDIDMSVVTAVQEEGSVVVSTPLVRIEKFRYLNDLGKKEVFAIQGSSRVHPDIPKGEEVTVTIAKADVGSTGGHGTAPGIMLEAVAEVWMQAAQRGEILDFFITRVGDDISVTVTHAKGKDDRVIHELVWNGFMIASVIAKDNGWYGAAQDLLAEAFPETGQIRGAGPSITEIVIREQKSETLIFGQADKTAPGAFNRGLWEILFSPNTTWRPLGPGTARGIKVGVLDFDYNDHAGRHIWFGKEDYDYAAWYCGFPDRYTFDYITTADGEDIAAVTAQRLGIIAGEYVGKDDPMFIIRSQKKFAAVGEISSAFLKGDYVVPGWMRGSNRGPFFPVALMDAKIGIYDGPPLLSMWAFNLNQGRLTGFYDLMAANPAIRYVQDRRAARAVRMLEEGFDEMNLRLGPEEIEYQKGPGLMEEELAGRWETFEPSHQEDIVEQRRVDSMHEELAQEVAAALTGEVRSAVARQLWGDELALFAETFPYDIHYRLSPEVTDLQAKGNKAYPILINHQSLLKVSPDGIMALHNILEQLGRGNIQFVLHIARDDIPPGNLRQIVEDSLERINRVNDHYTRINQNMFAAIVVGTNPQDVSRQVRERLGVDIYQVIGPGDYVRQFPDVPIRVVLDRPTEGQMTLMAKGLKLGLELIPKEGQASDDELKELDELFSQDPQGNFHVGSVEVVPAVLTAADKYANEVEAAVRI